MKRFIVMYCTFLCVFAVFENNSKPNKNELEQSARGISEHIKILQDIHNMYAPDRNERKLSHFGESFAQPDFEHKLIMWCAKKIGSSRSLEPLFDVWDYFEEFRGRDAENDELFMRDCCRLIFIIYNKILCDIGGECQTSLELYRMNVNDVRDLYVKIALLPLAKFVNLLDKIVVGVTTAIVLHSQNSDGTILGWIKQNWWIPPTVIAGVITALVLG